MTWSQQPGVDVLPLPLHGSVSCHVMILLAISVPLLDSGSNNDLPQCYGEGQMKHDMRLSQTNAKYVSTGIFPSKVPVLIDCDIITKPLAPPQVVSQRTSLPMF